MPYKELETTGDARSVEVQFQAMLLNLPEVSDSQDRYITTGLTYGDESYIWVGQSHITTKETMKLMNVSRSSFL